MTVRNALHRRFLRATRGAVAVEFAIISPVLITMMGALYEIGHAFQAQTAANELASQYAISWADCVDNPVGTCATEISQYTPTVAIGNISPQLTAANVCLQMFQVTMSGTTPVVAASPYASPSPCTGGTTLSAAQTSAAQASLQSGQTGVIVTVNYTYTVALFPGLLSGVIPSSVPMSYTVVQLKA